MERLTPEEMAAAAMIAQPSATATPEERQRFENLRAIATGSGNKNNQNQQAGIRGHIMTAEQKRLARMIAGEDPEKEKEQEPESSGEIYAIGFDGTLCEDKYPEIGEPKSDAIEKAKELKAAGNILILWTCREGKELQEAVAWCEDHELAFDFVNQNTDGKECKKIAADHYIDNKNTTFEEL